MHLFSSVNSTKPTQRRNERTSQRLAGGFGIGVLVIGVALSASAAMALPSPDSGSTAGGTTVTVPVPGPDSFIQIAAGGFHSLALDAAGNIWSWGSDDDGQLGNGTTTGAIGEPTQITSGTTFTRIAAGYQHSLAIDSDGNLWSWGLDGAGQLGNGTATDDVDEPTRISTGTVFTSIAAGFQHSLALAADGTVWAWGSDSDGKIGNGDASSATVTTPSQLSTGSSYTAIAAGFSFSLAIDTEGNIWSWGADYVGQVGNGDASSANVTAPTQITSGTSFEQITAGLQHSLALDADGNVWSWGDHSEGQLGNGDASLGSVAIPTQITTSTAMVGLSAGFSHSLAVDTEGSLWSWGNDDNGRLGNGDALTTVVATPAKITTGAVVTRISAGYQHALALDSDGYLWSWGQDDYAQLGNGAATADVSEPAQITSGNISFTAIAAGGFASIAIDQKGNLWSWGSDAYGGLGNGTTTGDATTPAKISTGTVFTTVAAGYNHYFAIDNDGNLWGWGWDFDGEVGNGDLSADDVTEPEQLSVGTTFTAITLGYEFSLALDSDGNVWSWGYDGNGQLGNGAGLTASVATPTVVTSGTVYTAIAAGFFHSLAIDADGDLWAWGADYVGQAGNGDDSSANVAEPTLISSGTRFVDVSGGLNHSVALDDAGTIWSWGLDDYAQLGNGDDVTGIVAAPEQISAEATFDSVSAGYNHAHAIDSDSNLWSWGNDDSGVVGNGTATGNVSAPERITTDTRFDTVSAGIYHSLALDLGDNIWSWGRDSNGQLGNGTATDDVTEPTSIDSITVITSVSFGGVAGTDLERLSQTTASVVTPVGTAGTVPITINYSVNNEAQPALTLARPFSYIAPTPTPTPTATPTATSTPPASSVEGGEGATDPIRSTPILPAESTAEPTPTTTPGPTVTTVPTPTPSESSSASDLDTGADSASGSTDWLWIPISGGLILVLTASGIAIFRRKS